MSMPVLLELDFFTTFDGPHSMFCEAVPAEAPNAAHCLQELWVDTRNFLWGAMFDGKGMFPAKNFFLFFNFFSVS